MFPSHTTAPCETCNFANIGMSFPEPHAFLFYTDDSERVFVQEWQNGLALVCQGVQIISSKQQLRI